MNYVNVFIPAWTVPPIYHSLRREHVKFTQSPEAIGVKVLRPTWFEDENRCSCTTAELANGLGPIHRLRLSVREEAAPLREQPTFAALEEVAARGLLSFETWQCNRAHIRLKATIDVPLLGTVIKRYGDGLLDDPLMPVGWPLHLFFFHQSPLGFRQVDPHALLACNMFH